MRKFTDYLQVKEAAEFLGVSPSTLRNWSGAGKIQSHRHPVNGYRLFRQTDLEELLEQTAQVDAARREARE